ncbi:hypothetical protein EV646_116144 [Kribbella antiqua]|uniref:Uncharacterized protein n=1 Tax=Kribbella antiqua TaxID=2512217 RepID=A0A4R2IAC4_9ACTN|nr:hypothetical protein [Kribbella antiqua]TCO41052.1 hypothetical protein EV646_116144 [Kribbella antiqua]
MTAAEVLDSWWFTLVFVLACALNFFLVDRQTVGTWYSVALAVLVIAFVLAAGLSSVPLAIVAMVGFVVLVMVGLAVRRSGRRHIDRQS